MIDALWTSAVHWLISPSSELPVDEPAAVRLPVLELVLALAARVAGVGRTET